ncbi:MAG: hypothetical protein CMJ58_12800 [Planctomycetaceae bacterium]|nr:hypothetical protein [Planctomycetaceae bacterium]
MTTIGLDPGQRTGVAIYRDGKLCELRTVAPAEIEALIVEHAPALVVFEDSRMQSPVFSRGTNPRAMLKIARNVGEIDQLCRQIDDMSKRLGAECVGVSPLRKGSKLTAARFAKVTGWPGRSNQHERDAAMVAWPYRRLK